ncbi:MAG: HAD family hydrolase [Micropruina sp.]|uniref:HAD family hydrolase n=1 Tax=Micropruina sp. TaxID=2737536 RepID=UPI0039E2F737
MVVGVRAVLFDLFNTLIPGGSRVERDGVSRRMAEVLAVDPDDLAAMIRDTFDDRTRGRLGDLRGTVRWLASRLGATPSDAAVKEAVELRLEMTRALHRDTWALPALRELRVLGIARGLVSDCSAETPEIWADSPLAPFFEAVSFSCETGFRKPAPHAYLAATRQLGLRPDECLFVGDGGSFELTGAQALGMHTVRLVTQGANAGESIDEDTEWSGPHIADLRSLLHLPLFGRDRA